MKFSYVLIFLILLTSCKTIDNVNIGNNSIKTEKFTNSGFTIIYSPDLYDKKVVNKKMNERDLIIFQRNLKKGTSVKITNPYNDKSILAKVGAFSKYPIFNNSVVSIRIANELEIDPKEPFIYITEVLDNNSFIAKKSKTYEEEKNVANKAPVDTISINNLNEKDNKNENKTIKDRGFNYSIKIADFYYLSSAKIMLERIKSEIFLKNVDIIKLSEKNFRVLVGPFTNLKSLQNAYNSVQNLEFENIEIIKND